MAAQWLNVLELWCAFETANLSVIAKYNAINMAASISSMWGFGKEDFQAFILPNLIQMIGQLVRL